MECKDALEETVFSQEYKAWIRAGNAGQSCCVSLRRNAVYHAHTISLLAERFERGEQCKEAVMMSHMFDEATRLVKTLEWVLWHCFKANLLHCTPALQTCGIMQASNRVPA